jgi:drug/metabolite transporter (DMT)-like permease
MLITSPSFEAGPPWGPGLLGYTGWDRVLIPLLGLLAFVPLLSVPGAFGPFGGERRTALLWTATVFATVGVLMLVATDTAQASLGWDQWQSRVLGGFRPYTGGFYDNHPLTADIEARRGWGWGAGLAFWACAGGLIACASGWCQEWVDRVHT